MAIEFPSALLAFTAGLIVTLSLRHLARRLSGPRIAALLWLLPPMLAVLAWLPAPQALPRLPLTALPTIHVSGWPVATTHAALPWLTLAWLAGASLGLLRLIGGVVRLHRHSTPLPSALRPSLAARGLQPSRARMHCAGPALLFGVRPLLLLPPDFVERFDSEQRELILRHEQGHLRHGDPWWLLLAEISCALLWFHPLVWLALPRLRLDLELICDARVLHETPHLRAHYAQALFAGAATNAAPALIPWLAEPQLKERLIMIQRPHPGSARRRLGIFLIAGLALGGATLAQAAGKHAASQADQPASGDLTVQSRNPPKYPADAIANKQQGMVMLMVLVGIDGTPRAIKIDRNATTAPDSLVAAAKDAAVTWRFNPAMRHGKPIEGYARVPVEFNLDALPGKASGTPANASTKA